MNRTMFALVGMTWSCADDARDSSAPSGEGDADTDADTDTDTDTDTPPEVWDADAIMVDAWFGYDATSGTIVTGLVDGKPQENLVLATVFNRADVDDNPASTQYCFIGWTIPDGAVASNDDFDDTYWLSFDLSQAKISASGTQGDCDHLGSFGGVPRGSKDLTDFAGEFGLGFGVKSIASVDGDVLQEWEAAWDADGDSAPWEDEYATFAGGAFTAAGRAPADADIMLAFAMDPETHDVDFDGATGTGTNVELGTEASAPTGWYASIVMYYYGL